MNTSESGITQGDRLNAIKASRRIQNLTNSSHKQVTPIATLMNNNFSYETTTYPASSSSNYNNNHASMGTMSAAASYTMNTSVDLTNTISRGGTGANTRRSAALHANQANTPQASSNNRVSQPVQTNSLPKGSKSSTIRQSHNTTPVMSVNVINNSVSTTTSNTTTNNNNNSSSNYLPSSSGLTTVTIGQTISNPNATNSFRRTTRSITNALANNNNNSVNNLHASPTMITTTGSTSNTKRYF